MRQRGCSYFPLGLKREYKVCNFGLKVEIRWSLKRRGEGCWSLKRRRDPLVTQADLSGPRVRSPAVALFHKKGLRHRRKICANSSWLYSYDIQSSPSKSKNINYMFIYLGVHHCLSSGAICDSINIMSFRYHDGIISNKRLRYLAAFATEQGIHFKYSVRWQKLLGSARSGSTALS